MEAVPLKASWIVGKNRWGLQHYTAGHRGTLKSMIPLIRSREGKTGLCFVVPLLTLLLEWC